MNRSVTAFADSASLAQAALACATGCETIINGPSWKGIDGIDRVLITVIDRGESLKSTKVFRDLKRKGYLASWERA